MISSPLRLTRLALCLAAVSAAAACATRPDATVAEMATTTGAPEPMRGYDWFLNRDDDEVSLAYGVANSDDVKLHLSCQAGAGALELTASADKPRARNPSGIRRRHRTLRRDGRARRGA